MTNGSTLSRWLYEAKFRLGLRSRLRPLLDVVDAAALPVTGVGAAYFRALRRIGLRDLEMNRALLARLGVFPMVAHYYEPMTRREDLRMPMTEPRDLPGVELDVESQLELLKSFSFGDELDQIPVKQDSTTSFGWENGTFGFADAAFYYSFIRRFRPGRIIEVGAGNSTLVAQLAIKKNRSEGAVTRHVCIEPFEMPWLESAKIEVVRKRVEETEFSLFEELVAGDVLFIDSSHVIRPQGDVLFLHQRVLPRLKRGVVVHVHDIFTPRDYPEQWVIEKSLMWDEQYLLEALLTFNREYRVLGALNHLYRSHFEALASAFPILRRSPEAEPMSFWMRRE